MVFEITVGDSRRKAMQNRATVIVLSERMSRRHADPTAGSDKTEFYPNSWLFIVGMFYLAFGLLGYVAAA
jgi:hypothetical protein